MNDYKDKTSAENYIKFLSSPNGKIQQEFLFTAITQTLPANPGQCILDAGCGPGWLAKKLADIHPATEGCDNSEALIKHAKKEYRGIEFTVANLEQPLPYEEQSFDAVIMNMVAIDLENLVGAFENIFTILKPTGQLIVTIPNPYYTYPVAEWKRGIWRTLIGKKPKLIIKQPYAKAVSIVREFRSAGLPTPITIQSHFYPLSDYINCGRKAGLTLVNMKEIMSEQDSPSFNLRYQLHRYPLLLLLEFAKPGVS